MAEQTVYEAVGGMPFFLGLIDRFYDRVATDLLLRPLYPDDLSESRDHMVKFLAQYWGGPTTYSEERGHPRLRMRHAPFVITSAERDAWLRHMIAAIEAGELTAELEQQMIDYFSMAATHMINT
ncbi:MAG: globin [Acidimicrobiales bacterium]